MSAFAITGPAAPASDARAFSNTTARQERGQAAEHHVQHAQRPVPLMASAIRFAMMHPTVRPGTAAGVSTASTHTASEMRNCTGPQASPCSAKSVMRVAAAYTAAIMPAWATYVVFLFMDMLLFSARRGAAGFGQLVIRECRAQRCKRGAPPPCAAHSRTAAAKYSRNLDQ